MNKKFITQLKDALVYDIDKFVKDNSTDKVYGMAIIMGQAGNYLGLAFATENGLEKAAKRYLNSRNSSSEEQRLYTSIENLKSWLKWANPDDGWQYVDFSEKQSIDKYLEELTGESAEDDIDREIEKGCIKVLQDKKFQDSDIIFGVTSGEDSDDFLRTATMINTYTKVRQLWSDAFSRRELDC